MSIIRLEHLPSNSGVFVNLFNEYLYLNYDLLDEPKIKKK